MLNGKQKRYLRSLAVNEKALAQIGKDGLSYNLFNTLDKALTARGLIKVALLKTAPLDINAAAIELAAALNCEIVQIIGRHIVLYRLSKAGIIDLP